MNFIDRTRGGFTKKWPLRTQSLSLSGSQYVRTSGNEFTDQKFVQPHHDMWCLTDPVTDQTVA